MLTLSPPFFPNFAWPLLDDDPNIISSHESDTFFTNNNNNISVETSDSLLPSPQSTNFKSIAAGETTGIVKKLNHNASERDRRKKINNLYSSLFSLLPESDRMKKLSIPATVSCVVKYIPELQKEVEKLVRKKEELSTTRMCRQQRDEDDDYVDIEHQLNNKRRKMGINGKEATSLSSPSSSSLAVTISAVGGKQVIVQISALKAHKGLLPEALNKLELDAGLFLLNASSFQSIGVDRVFHNLHFQAQGQFELELQVIKEKILSLYEKIN